MFKINLKRAIQCPTGDKAIMRIGIHNIDDETFSHWFIQGLLHQGDIEIIGGQSDTNPIKIPDGLKTPKYTDAVLLEVIPGPVKKHITTVVKDEPELIIEEVIPEAKVVEVVPVIEKAEEKKEAIPVSVKVEEPIKVVRKRKRK